MNEHSERQRRAIEFGKARQAVGKAIVKACNGYRIACHLQDPYTAQQTWEFACTTAEESNYLLFLSIKRNVITIGPSL